MYYLHLVWILFIAILPHLTEGQIPEEKNDFIRENDYSGYLSNIHWKDSLQNLLSGQMHDTLRVSVLILLSDNLGGISKYNKKYSLAPIITSDSIFAPAYQAYALANKINFQRGRRIALRNLGTLYEGQLTDYSSALSYYQQALKIAVEQNLYIETHMYLGCVLNIYFYWGDFTAAMKAATQGLALAEKRKDITNIAKYTSLFGFINFRQGNLEESKKFYDQYLQQSVTIGDSVMMADAYNCLGEIYAGKEELKKALSCHFKALNFYERKDWQYDGVKDDRIPYTLFKVAIALQRAGNYKEALKYSLQVLEEAKYRHINDYDLASYYINTGNIYKELRNFNQAEILLRAGLAISLQIRHAENARDAYRYLAETYSLQKQYKSAHHFNTLFHTLKDSITNEKTRREIEQIHSVYSIEKKDHEITQQQEAHEAEINRQQLIQYALISFFVFLVVISFLLYNRFKLKQENKFQQILNQKQNELFNSIVSIQDKERKRISQDLHDSLGSILSAAKLKLSDIDVDKGILTAEEMETYRISVSLLDEAVIELRNVSHNIMPATLSKIGLIAALRNIFDKISSHSSLKISYTTHGFIARLQEDTEISLYQILLELVNNVIKHAQANEVTVQLIRYPEYINIIVEDDGVGFESNRRNGKSGIGLDNIISRVDYLKGTVDIDTGPGKGTSIIINIPFV